MFDWTVEPCLRVSVILAVSITTEAGMLESVLAFRRMDVEVLPLDEVLQLVLMPIIPVIDNGLDFILLLTLNQIRQWSREVGAVSRGLLVWQE